MKKALIPLAVLSLAVIGLFTTAAPVAADAHQGNPGTAFVCPVISSSAVGEHNPIAGPLGIPGYWTVVPATSHANGMNVPDGATNMNGAGDPHTGPFAAPGDPDYSAIWSGH